MSGYVDSRMKAAALGIIKDGPPETDFDRRMSRIEDFKWFHSIDLGDGRITPGIKSVAAIAAEEKAFFDPVDLKGATVLDVGAWNGAFTFAAARRGAARVLATDKWTWDHPHWRGKEAFDIAKDAVSLPNIESLQIDVPDISPDTVGIFDVVLFLGVLYHLPSPLEGLEKVADVTGQCLIVETHTDLNEINKPALAYYPGTTLNGDGSNFFGPNSAFVIESLRECGFKDFDIKIENTRLLVHAWKSQNRRLGKS